MSYYLFVFMIFVVLFISLFIADIILVFSSKITSDTKYLYLSGLKQFPGLCVFKLLLVLSYIVTMCFFASRDVVEFAAPWLAICMLLYSIFVSIPRVLKEIFTAQNQA